MRNPLCPKPDPGPDPPLGSMAAECMTEVNRIRESRGLSRVDPSSCLISQAQQHSENMSDSNRLSHTGFSSRLSACGYFTGSENVAQGYDSARSVVAGWLSSPGHRANILKPSWTHAGVGYVGGRHWWTIIFAK